MKKKILTLALVLALLVALVIPASVALAEDTEVSGTLSAYWTLNVPGTVGIGALDKDAATSSSVQTISVATNEPTESSAKVEVAGTNAGCLNDGTTSLSTALTLAGTNCVAITLTGVNQELVTAAAGILDSGVPEQVWTTAIDDLVITQPAFDAAAAGTYTCTITFTATFE